jgi:glyoxylase-like metal-dependent hydrolase (beta-lactamase superfamily II)
MASATDWEIKSIVRGRLRSEKSFLLQSAEPGTKLWFPSTVYYVTNGDRHVLVDTGYGDPAVVAPTQTPFEFDTDSSLPELLEEHAVPPAEFDTVFVSHLHWDHAGNVGLFDDLPVDVYAQREAVKYAYAPLEIHERGFLSPGGDYEPSWLRTDFTFIDGDELLAPGLRAIHTPGHSPGHTSLLVESGETTYGLAIDVAPLAANIGSTDLRPPGCMDVFAWWESAKRLREEADVVIPSHDPEGPGTEWITDRPG